MYAVYQSGLVILALGETREDAIANAKREMDSEEASTLEDDIAHGDKRMNGDVCLAKCTPLLAATVEKSGGDVYWEELKDGTLCLPSENPT